MTSRTAHRPHPDRVAPTLAVRARLLAAAADTGFAVPGPGSDDARVDLKLLAHRVRQALAERGTDAARAHLAGLDTPDLWAGTVQDATARGFRSRLEEALSLCEPPAPEPDEPLGDAPPLDRKSLRRRRDLLVASGGARARFSRKGGVLFVDRERGVHREHCIRFEDRRDAGDLDGFSPVAGERPRLFSPGFLTPVEHLQAEGGDRLVLEGRLGRRPNGYPCRIVLEGRRAEDFVRMRVAVRNDHPDHRLRVRFLGVTDPAEIGHEGTPGWERVHARGQTFVAATIVRACGRLRVGDEWVAVPDAQCPGWIEHVFRLGGAGR